MTDEVFIAKESVSSKLAEPAAPPTPAIPTTPTVPATPQKEIALATAKVKTDSTPASEDSTPVSEITARQADKKDMIAKIQATSQPQQGVPVATVPVMDEVSEETAALQEVVAMMDTFESESDKKMKLFSAGADYSKVCRVTMVKRAVFRSLKKEVTMQTLHQSIWDLP